MGREVGGGSFKQERAGHHQWHGLADSRAATHDYIEVFYNRQRLHSSPGYAATSEADEASARRPLELAQES